VKKTSDRSAAAALRRRAEASLAKSGDAAGGEVREQAAAAELPRLVQELRIHQIELEIQNEELKQARDEAEAERERYADLYDFAPVGYFTLDPGGIIRRANLAGALLLSRERSRLVNRRFEPFIAEPDRPAFKAFLTRVFVNRGSETCEVSLVSTACDPCHVHIAGSAAADGGECRATVTDVTERKLAEAALRRLQAELEQRVSDRTAQLERANRELESFSYSVSHDLQTPLRAIDGYARMILRRQGESFDADTRQKFDVIRTSIQKMAQLIDALLAFSRLGRRPLSLVGLDIETLVGEAWKDLEVDRAGREIVFKTRALPPGKGDRMLIRQVIVNLLANAIKFTRPRDKALIEAGGQVEGREVVCYIRDNGVGFNMAYYEKLFGMFQQLHSPEQFEGTGVGLAIAQRIIARHGGRIWAESKENQGTTFFFTLPAA
jgi:signal transduction histidine kinase